MKSVIEIFRLISSTIRSKGFIDRHRICSKNFTRSRKLPFDAIVGALMQMARKSLQIECNHIFSEPAEDPASKQAFSKARYKVDVGAFQELHQQVLHECYQDNNQDLWKGYRVFAGDGSLIRLPQQQEITEFFGKREGDKVSLARVFEYVEITTDVIVSAAIAPSKISESYLAKEKLPELTKQMKALGQNRQLYIYDRGFRSYQFMQQHRELGVDFLIRMSKCFSPQLNQLAKEGALDELVTLKKDNVIHEARVIFFQIPEGEMEILLTSLTDQQDIKREELIDLYQKRWRCEESFKLQKQTLQLENFIGGSVHAVCQEFWATILMATMLTLFCNEAEKEDPIYQQGNGYKVNRSVVFGSMRKDFFRALRGKMGMDKFKQRFEVLARRSKIPIRPGRSYSREGLNKPKHGNHFSRSI